MGKKESGKKNEAAVVFFLEKNLTFFVSVRPVRGPRPVPPRRPVALVLQARGERRSMKRSNGSSGIRRSAPAPGGSAPVAVAVLASAAAAAPVRPRHSADDRRRRGLRRPGHRGVDRQQRAADHVRPTGDDAAQGRARLEGDEGESAVLSCRQSFLVVAALVPPPPSASAAAVPVPRQVDVEHEPEPREVVPDVVLGGLARELAHEDARGGSSSSGVRNRVGRRRPQRRNNGARPLSYLRRRRAQAQRLQLRRSRLGGSGRCVGHPGRDEGRGERRRRRRRRGVFARSRRNRGSGSRKGVEAPVAPRRSRNRGAAAVDHPRGVQRRGGAVGPAVQRVEVVLLVLLRRR